MNAGKLYIAQSYLEGADKAKESGNEQLCDQYVAEAIRLLQEGLGR